MAASVPHQPEQLDLSPPPFSTARLLPALELGFRPPRPPGCHAWLRLLPAPSCTLLGSLSSGWMDGVGFYVLSLRAIGWGERVEVGRNYLGIGPNLQKQDF